jgi:hypothetical protein
MEKRLIQYLGFSDSGDMVLLLHRSHFEDASSMVYPLFRQHPENCVNEVRQKDRTFYIRLKNTQL